jgi:hypothetical protein
VQPIGVSKHLGRAEYIEHPYGRRGDDRDTPQSFSHNVRRAFAAVPPLFSMLVYWHVWQETMPNKSQSDSLAELASPNFYQT